MIYTNTITINTDREEEEEEEEKVNGDDKCKEGEGFVMCDQDDLAP